MRQLLRGGVAALAGVLVLATASATYAVAIKMPNPVGQRAPSADVILIGTVKSLENQEVETTSFPGQPQKVKYRIAVVSVDENLLGAKGEKTVRVGFMAPVAVKPGGPIRPGIRF